MKKTALIAAALSLVLALAACGNRDNDSNNQPNNQTGSNGSSQTDGYLGDNSTTPNDQNGSSITGNGPATGNGSITGGGTTTGNDTTTGNGSTTGNGTTTGNSSTAGNGSVTSGNTTADDNANSLGRSVGNDLRRAADDVGDAVTGMVDGTRNAVTHTTSTTTFQRMLENARVHDTDGVLTDGENSRW